MESWWRGWSVWEGDAVTLDVPNCCQFVMDGAKEAFVNHSLACSVEDGSVFGRNFRIFQNVMVPLKVLQ